MGRPLGNWHFIEVCGIWLREREGGAFRAEGIADEGSRRERQVAGMGIRADVRGARRGSCERSAGGILGQEIGIFTPYKFGSPGLETAVGGDGHSPVHSITVWICTAVWREQRATDCSRHLVRWPLRLSERRPILQTR